MNGNPKLKQLEIEFFKCFYERQTCAFALPNGESGSGLTVIVGENNAGKSSIIDAILKVREKSKLPTVERNNGGVFKIRIIDSTNKEKIITNIDEGAQIAQAGASDLTTRSFEIVSARRHWNHEFSGESGVDHLNESSFNRGRDPTIDSSLGGVLAGISRDYAKKLKFDSFVRSIIPEFNEWRVESDDGQREYIAYKTKGGITHRANLFGDGVISVFRIAANLAELNQNRVLVIDEPELSLHPQAQKKLARALSASAKDKQIIVLTHSPHMVSWEDYQNGANIFKVRKRGDLKSTIYSLGTKESYSSVFKSNYQQPQLLDVAAKELFFTNKIVFVEGQEDVGLFTDFARKNGLDLDFEFFGYGAGGAEKIPIFLLMAENLGIDAAAIFDGDKSDLCRKCENEFPESKMILLPRSDIRDKPKKDAQHLDTDEIAKQGMFDRKGRPHADCMADLKKLFEDLNSFFNGK